MQIKFFITTSFRVSIQNFNKIIQTCLYWSDTKLFYGPNKTSIVHQNNDLYLDGYRCLVLFLGNNFSVCVTYLKEIAYSEKQTTKNDTERYGLTFFV